MAPNYDEREIGVTVTAEPVEGCPTRTEYDVAGPLGDTPGHPKGTVVVRLERSGMVPQ